MIEKHTKKNIIDKTFEIGLIHSIVQVVALLFLSKGAGFLFVLALAEAPGWVALWLWVCLNYFFVSFILRQTLDIFFKQQKLKTLLRVTILPIIAGLISFGFYLLYYRFHFYYSKREYNVEDFYIHFWNITLTMASLFIIGEIIQIIRDRRMNR